MIPLIQKEVCENKKWMSSNDLLDVIAISESTPGPISVNIATYVGYKVAGILGAVVATLSLALPSFVIIFVISFFYKDFMKNEIVKNIFKGLSIGVIILLFNAALKLKKNIKFTKTGTILFLITLISLLTLFFLNITVQSISIYFILFGLLTGLVFEIISKRKENKK